MITLKSSHEIQLMRQAGNITAAARALAGAMVAPGVTTQEIDRAVYRFIKSKGAVPSFLGYDIGFGGYPASVCISVNDEVIHGIPGIWTGINIPCFRRKYPNQITAWRQSI